MRWVFALVLLGTCIRAQAGFDDSAADRLRLFSDNYELALSKANGAILGITDKTTPAAIAISSRGGCLWGSTGGMYRGGCSFGSAVRYQWNASAGTLALVYGDEATVTITPAEDWFDLKLALTNRTAATITGVLFPSDLVMTASAVQAAYFPYYLPGARLLPGFFLAHRSLSSAIYPSARAFADYVALDVNGGSVAWYTVNAGGRIAPAALGFQDDNKTKAGTFYAFHTFQVWVPDGQTFETPVVRVRVGQAPEETITAYREENGIGDYPDVADKLGDLSDTLASAPLVKMDLRSIGRTFADLSGRLSLIRAPAILHPVSYWPPAFDRNYPDFLPPDPQFGTTADFHAFVDAAHAGGLLVMPYTNPTWWDDQSPTVLSGPGVAPLAVWKQDGSAVYETYGPNRGFVASPYSVGVQNRVAALMAQWRDDVPVDLVLQDQIGSRSWLRDFNPAAPDPQGYSDRWLQLTRDYAAQNLMTEDGWDRLAATEVGFTGSLLTGTTRWDPAAVRWGPGSRGNTAFGTGLWEPYPLGVWLFHDKVLFYHHDLDDLPMNAGVEVLTWNAAFGVMAGYYWPELHSVNPDWSAIAAAFQPAVLSRTAGRVLSEYRNLADGVTESRFEDLAVIANWNADRRYEIEGYSIAPSGCLARADDGSVVGGVFVEQFNGGALSDGVHYLLVERGDDVVTVRQPSGSDTSITVTVPDDWDLSAGMQITPDAPYTLDGRRVTFVWARTAAGSTVDRYELRRAP